MENNIIDEKTSDEKLISLSSEGIQNLKTGRGWALFLAILGFIYVGFMMIGGLITTIAGSVASSQFNGAPIYLVGLLYLIVGGVMLIPALALYNFTKHSAQACNFRDNNSFNESISHLKKYFKSIGIITICMMALIPVIIIVAVIIGVSSGNMF